MTTITAGRRSEAAHAEKRTTDWRARYFNWFCAGVLLVFAAIWLVPLLWALDTSLKPDAVIAAQPTNWWSSAWTVNAYQTLFNLGNIQTWYLNSFVIALLSAVFAVLACSMAAFAIARTQFRGRRIVYGLIAAGLLIPAQVLIVPMFQEFNAAKLLNTYWVQVLPAVAVPIAVIIFVSFFNGIPADLAESARVDGASWGRVYRTI